MMTGRPERNSARPRCTPTCLGVPNRAELPLVLMSPHTLGPPNRKPLGPNKNAPELLLFHCRRLSHDVCSHHPTKISWHDTARSESRYYMMTDGRLGKLGPNDSRDPENGAQTSSWAAVPEGFRTGGDPLPPPWEELFGPLRRGLVDELIVVGQCGQSIDARIATPSGHSHYINGEAGLAHLHRLRALVDAVVIGVGTAIADDPQLTVRRVEGPSPARVIVDPSGRLPSTRRGLTADGIRRLVVTAAGVPARLPSDIEIVPLAADNGALAPAAIVAALAGRGFPPSFIEGGGATVSSFPSP